MASAFSLKGGQWPQADIQPDATSFSEMSGILRCAPNSSTVASEISPFLLLNPPLHTHANSHGF